MKQKNISMDIKNGVSELDELLDVIEDHRRRWKLAEEAQRARNRLISLSANAEQTTSDEKCDVPMSGKRSASSPAKNHIGKKHKVDGQVNSLQAATTAGMKKRSEKTPKKNISQMATDGKTEGIRKENGGKQPVESQEKKPAATKKTRKRMPKYRSNAVVVKPAEGHSYADVLRTLKATVKPEEADVKVRSIRKTRTGALLLEVAQGGKVGKFSEAIRKSLKEAAEVKDLKPKITIEIRDIDCTSTIEDVIAAVCRMTGTTDEDITAQLTKLSTWDQRRAFVQLPTSGAKKLLKAERIKIGWTNCRLKYREEDKRCFKCFGLGHEQRECRGQDRKARGICIRCGEEGHMLKQCPNSAKCCICAEQGKTPTDHLPGSRSCKADRQS